MRTFAYLQVICLSCALSACGDEHILVELAGGTGGASIGLGGAAGTDSSEGGSAGTGGSDLGGGGGAGGADVGCAGFVCDPNATCDDTGGTAQCTCNAGYQGDGITCADIDECAQEPCLNDGVCVDGIDVFTCECAAGFEGDVCETNIDDCDPNPCQNGGACADGVDTFTCDCADGFDGALCATNVDDCAAAPCQNGGACIDGVDSFTCDCADGFDGALCATNVDDCAAAPCQNGGACIDGVDSFTCDCADGFDGALCANNVNDCAVAPCLNGGSCIDGVGSFTCDCAIGFDGAVCATNIDDCDPGFCLNGGACLDGVASFTCDCAAGFDGASCENDIDECDPNPCQHGGTCTDGIADFTCSCPVSYEGDVCETNVDECLATLDDCHVDATCFDTEGSFTCACEEPAYGDGTSCETLESCVDILAFDPGAESGLYTVLGATGPIEVYCDMTTDGGGWMLLSKFSQPSAAPNLSSEDYEAYFRTNLWIEGASQGAPQSPSAEYDAFHVESLDWRDVLLTGSRYELRQNFFKGAASLTFDVAYSFEYNGHVTQNGAPEAERAWPLTDRRVLTDDTGIVWDTPSEIVRFWLPFTAGASGNLYTGCGGFLFESTGCNMLTSATRRFGNAGIIGAVGDGNDPAASFAPHMNAENGNFDIVYVHQGAGVYGLTGGNPMALLYWVRELPPANCGEILDGGDSEGDGIYEIDPDGAGPIAPMDVFCDMTVDGGGWTLLANIKGDTIFHSDQINAVGDATQLVEDAKLSDGLINQLTPNDGFWRFDCGTSSAFVRTASSTWTSLRDNAEVWTLDRGRDGTFECPASRTGYTFSDLACAGAGSVNWGAAGGVAEGTGCFQDPNGWAQPGRLWVR